MRRSASSSRTRVVSLCLCARAGLHCAPSGRALWRRPEVKPSAKMSRAPAGNRQRTCFIGNISFDATEEELRTLMSQAGTVVNLRLVVDRDTGKRKGFAFLEYSDPETAQRAVAQLNGLDFYGRTLRVSIAEQDTKHAGDGPTHAKKRKGAGAPGAASIQADAPSKLAQSKVIRQAAMPVPSAVARLGRSVTTIRSVMTAG